MGRKWTVTPEHVYVVYVVTGAFVINYTLLVHLLGECVYKAARYMENKTHKNIMFLKWNIMSSGNVTF